MFAALAAHLWQSTRFALAAALLTLGFRRNRAHVRYTNLVRGLAQVLGAVRAVDARQPLGRIAGSPDLRAAARAFGRVGTDRPDDAFGRAGRELGPRRSSRGLGVLPDKKMIVYFSIADKMPDVDPVRLNFVIAELERSQTAVYQINVRGLIPTTDDGSAGALPAPPGPSSISIFRSGDQQVVSISLAALSGQVEILGRVETPVGETVASVQDKVPASTSPYQAKFLLKPGVYLCTVTVKESATGQAYEEKISFVVR